MATPATELDISVVICTYNRRDALNDLLHCLLAQKTDRRFSYEIILVDNNSADGTKTLVESLIPQFGGKLRYYFEPRQGKPYALNLGIKESRGEVLAFTDDDCLLDSDYLQILHEVLVSYQGKMDLLGGKILPKWVGGEQPSLLQDFYPSPSIDRVQWSGSDKPAWLDSYFLGPLGILDYGEKAFIIDYSVNRQGDRLFYGANMAVRREIFAKYGDFQLNRTITQDMEICLRFLKAGAQGLYEPRIKVLHKIDVNKVNADYYYRWYFKRGKYLKDLEKYTVKFYHPFGIQWTLIGRTAVLLAKAGVIKPPVQKIYYGCKGLFNLGRMIEIAKEHTGRGGAAVPAKLPDTGRPSGMRILFVRTYCPNPINYGSEMRSGRLVDYLSRFGNVDLLTLTKPTNLADEAYIKAKFKTFTYFDCGTRDGHLTAFEKSIALLPWQLAQFYSKDIQRRIQDLVEANEYDLIFIHKLDPLLYFLKLPGKWHDKTVIDFDDILSDLYFNYYKNPVTAQKNSNSLRLYEQKALKQFKRILVCSHQAKLKMDARYRDKVIVAPNVFEAGEKQFLEPSRARGQLLFVGSLDYFANLEGLKWFIRHVWPAVKQARPELKLSVVGKTGATGAHVYSSLGSPSGVEVVTNVASVYPYYQKCFLSIVPLLNGSGTRLKILESAAYGRPVITTSKGMEGLDFEHGRDIFVFRDARSFIEAYEALLDDKTYKATARRAFETLTLNYSQKVFDANMNKDLGFIHEQQLA